MKFDSDNKIVQLCAQGMNLEGEGKQHEAYELFMQAWKEAANDLEKFISAHYVARHQTSIQHKLNWDKTALAYALKINDNGIQASYPSLYLNIAKCLEDLKDFTKARKNYQVALSYANHLPDNGYGHMIKSGIESAIKRLSEF